MDKILLIVSGNDVRSRLEKLLKEEGYDVIIAKDFKDTKTVFGKNDFGAVLLDISLPEKGSIKILKYLRSDFEQIPVIMITGKESVKKAEGEIEKGAYDYILKSVKKGDFARVLKRAVEMKHLKGEKNKLLEENTQKQETLDYLSNMVNNPNELVFTFDKNLMFINMNPAGEAMTGYTKEELAGKLFLQLPVLYKEVIKKVAKVVPKMQKEGRLTDLDLAIMNKKT